MVNTKIAKRNRKAFRKWYQNPKNRKKWHRKSKTYAQLHPDVLYYNKHGITFKQKRKMWKAQGGKCAGCERAITWREANTDHDHAICPKQRYSCNRCRRGLLCSFCNTTLGLVRDNSDTLRRLSEYIINFRRKLGAPSAR